MPEHIGNIYLYSLEYAEDPMSKIVLPDAHLSYGKYNNNVLESLFAAVPQWGGIEVVELHCNRIENGCEAAFTWYHTNYNRMCTTQFWGDGIYYLTGVIEDGTVIRLMFDTHCMSRKTLDDLGNVMCDELMVAMNKEEEYEHVRDSSSYGTGIKRGRRIPEKVTLEQLLTERGNLIEKRQNYLEKLRLANNGKIWQNAINRVEEELHENAELLKQK